MWDPEEHVWDRWEDVAGFGVAQDESVVWRAETRSGGEETEGLFHDGVGVFEFVDDVRVGFDRFCGGFDGAEDFVVFGADAGEGFGVFLEEVDGVADCA